MLDIFFLTKLYQTLFFFLSNLYANVKFIDFLFKYFYSNLQCNNQELSYDAI